MKSYKQWTHAKRYMEFVGPAGQVDPQGIQTSNAAAPVVQAQQPANVQMSQDGNPDDMMAQVLKSLQNKTPQQVMAAQQAFNNGAKALLQATNAGPRKGVANNFKSFQAAKANVPQPVQQLQIPS